MSKRATIYYTPEIEALCPSSSPTDLTATFSAIAVQRYAIWHQGQSQYLKPDKQGYTPHITEAGQYHLRDALAITDNANQFNATELNPMVFMLPVSN